MVHVGGNRKRLAEDYPSYSPSPEEEFDRERRESRADCQTRRPLYQPIAWVDRAGKDRDRPTDYDNPKSSQIHNLKTCIENIIQSTINDILLR